MLIRRTVPTLLARIITDGNEQYNYITDVERHQVKLYYKMSAVSVRKWLISSDSYLIYVNRFIFKLKQSKFIIS